MEEETVIRPAAAADAAALAEFAERVFDEVFGPLNDPGDMASYLNEAFSPDIQRAEIDRKSTRLNSSHESTSRMPSSA